MREHPSDRIDLRSDTVTQPTKAMRDAMHNAVVGDDVLQDDPTVIKLEQMIADMCGKDAALFVPSGTMSNAVAIRAHTSPGDEIILERTSHIYQYEGGGYAAMSGVSVALVDGQKGQMTPEQVQSAIRKQSGSLGHYPDGTLVCVENTANRGGGTCYSQETLDAIADVAHENGCKIHMDGARIFNAAIKTNTDLKQMLSENRYCLNLFIKRTWCPSRQFTRRSSRFYTKRSKMEKDVRRRYASIGNFSSCWNLCIGKSRRKIGRRSSKGPEIGTSN